MRNEKTRNTLAFAGVIGAALAVGILSAPVEAGFKSNGWPGNGFATSEIPAAPTALTPGQQMYLDAVKAANPGLSDADARTKASAIHEGLCKAIDLVKKQNATVGACLAKLKKKGAICVSFNMKDAVGGAINDGKADCNENDKINISSKKLAEGCPPPYDPALYWVATILLHEGTHAEQDYSTDTTGLDACKARAKRTMTRLCNEAGTGMGGEPKGAHVIENEWIDEIKEALDELESIEPTSMIDWSDATTEMFNGIFPLPEPQRQNAIDALRKAACANKRGNDRAIDCYRKAKMKLQNFIDTNYTSPDIDPSEKQAAQQILRDCLNTAKWKWVFKFFDIPAKSLLSSAESGIIEQFDDDSTANDLDTGLMGVSDMELLDDGIAGDPLDDLVVAGPNLPGMGEAFVYYDGNDNDVFEPSEQTDNFPLPPGVAGNVDLIPPQPELIGIHPWLLFDHDSFSFYIMTDNNLDGIPDGVDPIPVFQILLPELVDLAHLIQEWNWDGQRLVGFDDMITGAPVLPFDAEVLVLEDQNGDGIPDFEVPFADMLPLVQFGPTWGGEPLPGDIELELYGYPGHQVEVQIVDPVDFVPIQIVALGLTSVDPITVTLDQPLAPLDHVLLVDLNNGLPSPLLVVRCPGDINGDGVVDTADLGILIGQFGETGFEQPADINGDCVVDTADLGILVGNFGCGSVGLE